ncbi:hypothetical protein B0T21DRAFT_249268, partial [Apiosordaria backusii]
ISRSNIHIELTQENILLIRGHVDRPYNTSPPSYLPHKIKRKPVTVMGEKCDDCNCGPNKPCGECEKNKCECTKGKHCDVCRMDTCPKHEGKGTKGEEKAKDNNATIRYLLKDRFIKDFLKEFTFPKLLQEFNIKARLKNRVLKVMVPK